MIRSIINERSDLDMEPYWEKADHSWTSDSIRLFSTPTTRTKKLFYYVQEIGHFKALKPYFTERQNLTSYLLTFTLSGQGRLLYQNQDYLIEKNELFFIDCKNYQRYQTVSSSPWEMNWIHFYGPNVDAFYEEFIRDGSHVLKVKNDRITKIIKQIIDLQQTRNAKTEFQISLLIHDMLNELIIQKYNLSVEADNMPDYIVQLKGFLEENYTEKITLHDLEKKSNLNKFQVSKDFTRFVGIPPIDYLIHVRINVAKSMLRYTNKTVKEIAFDVGIDDSPYFNRLFKQKTDMTPLEYRRNG